MPLVSCPACGRPVSVHAAACPNCGHPQSLPAAPARPDRTLLVVFGAALVVVALLGGLGWFVFRQLSANAEARRHRPPEELVDYQEVVDSPAAPVAVAPPAGADGTRELSEVDEQPQLLNRDAIATQLSRNYPPLLRDAGVVGSANVRLRVMRDGSVDPESITVENATHPMFGEAASRVVERMRFRPAKIHGEPVPVWVTLPVTFQLQR
jgi:TonB family protein